MTSDANPLINQEIKKKSFSFKRVFLSVIFLSFFIGAIFFIEEDQVFLEDFSSTSSTTTTLMSLMKYDFQKLKKSNSLPPTLYNVKQIQFFNRSESLNLEKNKLENFINLKQAGKFKLTVEFYPFPEDESAHLVQFNWINVKTKDKVWEVNRVYKLNQKR